MTFNFRKILFLILIVILVILISAGIVYLILAKDEPPSDDSDLRLSAVNIPEEENAFYPLEKAAEKLYLPYDKEDLIDKILKEEDWDQKFVEELLKKNEETFYYFDQALTRSKFQDPGFSNPEKFNMETPILHAGDWRKIARLDSIRASYFLKQGKEKEAFDEAVKIIKFGQIIQSSQKPFILYLVSIAIKGTGLIRIKTMAVDTNLPPELLKNHIEQLNEFKPNEGDLINALKIEYISIANVIDDLAVGKKTLEDLFGKESPELKKIIKPGYSFKPNQTKRLFADSYRLMFKQKFQELESQVRSEQVSITPPIGIIVPNRFGKLIHSIGMVSLQGAFSRKSLEDFSVIGDQILLALKGYHINNSRLPNDLSKLVPEYFSEIPKDPFDGNPIRYSQEKKIIYSSIVTPEDLKEIEKEGWQYAEEHNIEEHILKFEF